MLVQVLEGRAHVGRVEARGGLVELLAVAQDLVGVRVRVRVRVGARVRP